VTAPSLPSVKALFARSKNRCAFPECDSPVVENTGTVTAEICHIRALNSRGPRHDKTQTPEERNSASNLILMCGRHHKIIDTETKKFTSQTLLTMKRAHEERGVAEISPQAARVAQQLLSNYLQISIVGNSGNIAIQSPGTVQAKSVTFKNTRTRVSLAPPDGSIGAARAKVAYCQHLIDRYQEYQKADRTGKSEFKYAAIHGALKRTFRTQWKLLEEERFNELVAYLQKRIDATIIGKINRAKGQPNFSSFEA
jgi:hypothetical protein